MGPKRGRLLIRQPRVKRDSDNTLTGGSTHSPDAEFEAQPPFSQRLLTVPHHSVHTQHLHQPQLLHQTHQHHHHHAKMERHASEPAPSNMSTITSAHLLSVPSQTPFLVKQHSHPLLLPSQSSLDSASGGSTAHYLYRQLSYPTTSDSNMSLLIPMSTAATSSIISSAASSSIVTTPSCCSPTTSSMAQFIDRPVKNEDQPDLFLKVRTISPSIVVMTDTTPPTTAETMPTIRVKNEELQRSLSTPQPIRELSLESRSQHCPVIRPGPALGCNYCWNTIDAHGRILRRKTKYHCPECQTNLCIVPCFQEYHERQSNDPSGSTSADDASNKSRPLPSYSLRHYPKTGGSM